MAYKLLDRARMSVSGAPGAGQITLGSAVAGYQSFTQAGINDGDSFPYSLIDGNNWEYGVATYASAGGKLTRAVGKTSAQNATPLSLTNRTVITACLRAEDVQGATTLAGLTDVSIPVEDVTIDGYVLTWDNGTGRWKPVASASGSSLAGLSDVAITSLTSGQFLRYNGTKWANSTLSLATVASTGAYADLSGTPTIYSTLVTLTDVNITTGGGVDGYVVYWDNGTSRFKLKAAGGGSALTIKNAGTNVETATTSINIINATSITTSSGAVTLTLPTGGAGGGPGGTMTPPTAAALAAVTNLGSSVLTTRSSGVLVPNLHIQPLSSSNSTLYCALKAAPVGNFSLVVKVRVNAYNISGGWYGAGPVIHNSSGTLSVYCMRLVGSWATYVTKWTGGFTSVSFSGGQTFEDEDMFLHIDYDGTNYLFGASRNGKDAIFFFSEAVATFIGAITHVGIGWSGAYNSASGPEFDYEHFFAGTRGSGGL